MSMYGKTNKKKLYSFQIQKKIQNPKIEQSGDKWKNKNQNPWRHGWVATQYKQIGNNLKTTAYPCDSSSKHHDHHCPSGVEGQNTLASKAGNMGCDS